jgi:hypothetical protein
MPWHGEREKDVGEMGGKRTHIGKIGRSLLLLDPQAHLELVQRKRCLASYLNSRLSRG